MPAEHDSSQKAQLADQAEHNADKAAHERDRKTERANEVLSVAVQDISRWAAGNTDLTATTESDALELGTIADVSAGGPAALLGAAADWKDTATRRGVRGRRNAADRHRAAAAGADPA